MKNFTLRLTENEAEALTRLASMNGFSKNDFLRNLIAVTYGRIDSKAEVKGGVFAKLSKEEYLPSLCDISDLPKIVYERFSSAKEEDLTLEERIAIAQICDYSKRRIEKEAADGEAKKKALEELEVISQKIRNGEKWIVSYGESDFLELIEKLK